MNPQSTPPPASPQPKKTPIWIWLLLGLLGLFLLAGLAITAGAYLLYHKAKEVAVTAEKNPALAAAKVLAAVNPDLEVISTDEDRGLITIRDRKTGRTITVNLEDVRQGRISFEEEGKEPVTFEARGEGQGGRFAVRSKEGSLEVGQDLAVNLPAWFPRYPGAAISGTFRSRDAGEESLGFHFQTQDSAERILGFYEKALKAAGLEVERHTSQTEGRKTAVLSARDAAENRTALMQVESEGGANKASVTLVMRE